MVYWERYKDYCEELEKQRRTEESEPYEGMTDKAIMLSKLAWLANTMAKYENGFIAFGGTDLEYIEKEMNELLKKI